MAFDLAFDKMKLEKLNLFNLKLHLTSLPWVERRLKGLKINSFKRFFYGQEIFTTFQ